MANRFKMQGMYNSNGLYQFGIDDVQIKTNKTNTFIMRNAADDGDASITVNQLTSTIPTGTAPFVVSSTTPVANLTCDSANTVYDQNSGTFKKFWFGTATQYAALTPSLDTIYYITGA